MSDKVKMDRRSFSIGHLPALLVGWESGEALKSHAGARDTPLFSFFMWQLLHDFGEETSYWQAIMDGRGASVKKTYKR
jgi:hypothetical protein